MREQVDSSMDATKVNARYLHCVFVRWSFTVLDVALESIRIARDPTLRGHLWSVQASVQEV
jgi:hypothetical protein